MERINQVFDFPNSPITGDTIAGPSGVGYRWDGAKWVLEATTGSSGPFLPLSGNATVTGPVYYTATGGTVSRSAQDRAAEVVNVKDYGAKGDGTTNDTAAIQAAVAHALTIGTPVEVFFPAGKYVISATINVTTSANQMVWLRGASASTVLIIQTADADGIVMLANNVAGYADNGGMRVTGITLKMTAASTTRTGLKLSSAAVTGQVGALIFVDDVLFQSPTVTTVWGRGLVVQSVNGVATWLSHITSVYPNGMRASGLGIGVTIQSVSPNYSAGINLRDIYLVNGDTGLVIGDFLQGVHIQNLNTTNTLYAVKVIPTVGGQGLMEIHITDSYLHGQSIFGSVAFPTVLDAIIVHGTYFDTIGGAVPANTPHVSIIGASQIIFSNNIFNGPSGVVTGVTGLKITSGANGFEQLFTGNLFQAYAGTGSAAISMDSTTKNIMFVGNTLLNNQAPAVIDGGTNNQFSATSNDYNPYIWGSGNAAPNGQAWVDGRVNFKADTYLMGSTFTTGPLVAQNSVVAQQGINIGVASGCYTGIYGGAAGSGQVQMLFAGADANIGLLIQPKGGGVVNIGGSLNVLGGNLATDNAIYATNANAAIIVGSTTATGTPYIDFHSSGHTGHDAWIIASGGTGTLDGNLTVGAYLLLASQLQLSRGFSLWGSTPPGAKPVVTGAKGGNTALASVLQALVNYGLITDSST